VIAFAGGSLDPRGWRILQNIVFLEAASSSNDLARELVETYFAEEEELPVTVLVARSQTLARGRKGSWMAPPGRGIYLTIVRRAQPGEPLSLIPIAVGRWVRDILVEHSGLKASLKWPNDVYASGRKLAGILAESRTQGDDTYVAIGLGLNAIGAGDTLGTGNATTIEQETGHPVLLAPLLQALLDRFDRELSLPGWEREVEQWERVCLHRPGDRLTVRRERDEISGEYRGLTPEGFLRLSTENGETVCATGELARW
jgi:BirA family biotin operon repressor/biotin-[acetyl-CoA-carboxylase] ligase